MKRILLLAITACLIWGVLPGPVLGAEAEEAAGHGGIAPFLFAMVAMLLAAKIGGEIFERVHQPAVLGELVFGVILGNLTLVGIHAFEGIRTMPDIHTAAEIGVILLLFEVGLESNLPGLLAVGLSATLVALLGVIAPVILGYFVSMWFLPESQWYVHLFVGATLAATSVGITARVLKDLRKMETKEAQIILGAAVVDDVLGLIILAVVSGIVGSIDRGAAAEVSMMPVLWIIGKAVAFLLGAILIGHLLAGRVIQFGARARVAGLPVVLSLIYCFLLAGLAEAIGLAAIVGAFAAGLVLDETSYRAYPQMKTRHIEELVAPISSIFVPIFFVLMGIRVDLSSFGSLSVLEFAAGLSLAAILGKQICSLGILEKGLNRLAIGVGMIPRGEVGLIFAAMGARQTVGGVPVFSSETYSAMVVMVMVTTLATPPLLKYLMTPKRA
jgi:Kef-type K+ transport system membrane component KefB